MSDRESPKRRLKPAGGGTVERESVEREAPGMQEAGASAMGRSTPHAPRSAPSAGPRAREPERPGREPAGQPPGLWQKLLAFFRSFLSREGESAADQEEGVRAGDAAAVPVAEAVPGPGGEAPAQEPPVAEPVGEPPAGEAGTGVAPPPETAPKAPEPAAAGQEPGTGAPMREGEQPAGPPAAAGRAVELAAPGPGAEARQPVVTLPETAAAAPKPEEAPPEAARWTALAERVSKLEALEERVSRLAGLEERVSRLEALPERVSNLESQAEAIANLDKQVQDFRQELEQVRQWREVNAAALSNAQQLAGKATSFLGGLAVAAQAFDAILSQCRKPRESSPSSGGLVVPASQPAATAAGDAALEELPVAAPALDRARLAAEAWRDEESSLAKDRKDLDTYSAEAQRWAGLAGGLRQGISSAAQPFNSLLAECRKAWEALPPELQEKLRERHRGLDLIGKMFSRLQERAPADEEMPRTSLPFVEQRKWHDLLAREATESSARRTIQGKLRQVSMERYQLVNHARTLAERTRKNILRFLEKEVLKVLDPIDEGEQNSEALVKQMKADSPTAADSLEAWYQTYSRLRKELLGVLGQVGVQPMQVEIGKPVDYDRHEPAGTEPDPQLPNECVRTVTRKGYEYRAEKDGAALVVRPAQVIVVKN